MLRLRAMATLGTTTFMGSGFGEGPLLDGLAYSLPILAILGAHEFGHYFACRYHNVDATLPFFIPAPPPVISGTFGAVRAARLSCRDPDDGRLEHERDRTFPAFA